MLVCSLVPMHDDIGLVFCVQTIRIFFLGLSKERNALRQETDDLLVDLLHRRLHIVCNHHLGRIFP